MLLAAPQILIVSSFRSINARVFRPGGQSLVPQIIWLISQARDTHMTNRYKFLASGFKIRGIYSELWFFRAFGAEKPKKVE